MRKKLHDLLESESHETWRVCSEAENGKQAVEKFSQSHPDVTVMDFAMPEMNGLQAAKNIIQQSPGTVILMLTAHTTAQLMEEAKKIGIKGFCIKNRIGCILDAVSALLEGETYFPNKDVEAYSPSNFHYPFHFFLVGSNTGA